MTQPKHTPLYDLHCELGAKMVPFAGYEMPVQYPLGVKKEHEHTRARCGLFDVSHMGQINIAGDSVAEALETLMPANLVDLKPGAQRYAIFTGTKGGILDDLMVVNAHDHFYLVVNAACKEQDLAHLRANLGETHRIENLDRGLLALQGPDASAVMARLEDVWISRCGYTGEDGFELSMRAEATEAMARRLLAEPEVEAIGLGARDSLRLEAGLCLYGHDMTAETTPVEAGLIWAVSKPRRHDGERPGGFPGADVILHQVEAKDHDRKRVGLIAEGKAPVREGTVLVNEADKEIGVVTSGGFGPSVGKPVAMGYVKRDFETPDTRVFALVRGKKRAMTVSKMPFVAPGHYRG
ncbi:glycine cleavage system aminomethyltransferase GcvT [Halomonas cibimaris]|uniref:Glycine cleavage system aminomethyltransferase GcvT n=1 Tax=Halomonas cibimaris TaxID=657012 RepID=A0ABP7LHB4_9GAMM